MDRTHPCQPRANILRQDINVFTARKESARAKSLIESTDRLKSRPTAGKISPVNQASREKFSGAKVLSVGFFLDCDPVILRIVEENSSADEPKSGIFFEAADNRSRGSHRQDNSRRL